ncbi:aldehyde dehydrogenase family protein [Pseudonocardia asaccharolytica]|uniref:Aldehyde dehydrogenase n=1 Tax=Pseudonocardia asaccharolytica DSM 44247 = NBRC 16224 TaxID=1123024 RepID=A0A511D792_9PSEU|nr:aldehyde dehydrogenase family protein [Pseudonocardia asaccharolytica]GEL20691.1 aldehyde dehydrogenase [Pseudonocardia asaccharolytica DSM 44247 = NBRC 16224]
MTSSVTDSRPPRRDTAPARHYIGGQWVTSTATGVSRSPATGEALGTYYEADEAQVREAIRVAKQTFATHEWRSNRQLRAQVLNEMADRIEAATDELALLLARENGKILPEAHFELSLTPSKLRYYAAQALTDSGRGDRVRPGVYSILLSEPVGVAGVIVPWNSPVVLAVRSFAPALAAGCTVVMKMAAQTALVNTRLTELLAECPSLPAGVLNVFTESGSTGAELLVSSPDVAALSYTGSTRVGRQIMANAGATLKRLSLELGGKTPMIVFGDADLAAAVGTIVAGITTFTGQFCMTGSRVLVHSSVADEVRTRLTEALTQVKVGPGDAEGSQMGPLIDIAGRDRLEALIEKHLGDAEVIVRGGRPDDESLARGAYYRPALLGVRGTDSPLVQNELFGPVATFEVFDTEEEAVRMANATQYGLAASVWTRDGARGLRMADALDAGTVWTNGWAVVLDQFEEGGYKQSGLGRLNGHRALEEFQEYKHVVQIV